MYERMFLIRRIEENVLQLYRDRYIGGYCHTYIGQEAILMGLMHCIKEDDTCITGYRCHGHLLEFGATPEQLICELLGRVNGVSRGKGGSMHLFWPQKGFYGGHGSVGSYVSFGTGLGMAHKHLGRGIAYTFFGEGAFNQGQVFESMNMASLWSLPVVYIIENNGYAISTSVKMSCAGGGLRHRAEPFGIQTVEADGMDPFDMIDKINWAANEVNSNQSPVLIEAKTYRYKGHSISDPATYRPKQEVEDAKHKDPIDKIGTLIMEHLEYKDGYLDDIKSRIKSRVEKAVEFAKNDNEASIDSMYEDIYSWNKSRESISMLELARKKGACRE